MPTTVKGWLMLIGMLWLVCVATPYAAADDLMDCIHRGKFAASMTYAVTEGYQLDKINVRFQIPPRNEAEQRDMDKYVESVRKEVGELLDGQTIPEKDQDFAARIGNKVAEACAFEYGKRHGYMKDVIDTAPSMFGMDCFRTNRRSHLCLERAQPLPPALEPSNFTMVGSSPPLSERQITEMIMGTASSTSIEGPPIGLHEACNNLRFDINVIARAISEGRPEEELADFARYWLPQLGQERLDRILRQIKEAYAWKKPMVEWMNKEYAGCVGNR